MVDGVEVVVRGVEGAGPWEGLGRWCRVGVSPSSVLPGARGGQQMNLHTACAGIYPCCLYRWQPRTLSS